MIITRHERKIRIYEFDLDANTTIDITISLEDARALRDALNSEELCD